MKFSTIAIIILIMLGLQYFTPTDDSDVNWWSRSGLTVSVDHATGCEYLSKFFGGVTPRMNADGKTQRGCKQNVQ